MKSVDSSEDRVRRPQIPKSSIATAKLCDFVTQSSITFFEKLGLKTQFIYVDPQEWEDREDFQDAEKVAENLAVVNDHAERGVAIVQEYSSFLTKDEDQLQFVLQEVQDHRKKYPDLNKKTEFSS